ncbi:hypothetical protein AB0O47_32785 [Streptomyces noursei]|uniref:hypothetical protein n=1 Tax=Streptomyces noursei TaxID=1971 RepID=UPI00344C8568
MSENEGSGRGHDSGERAGDRDLVAWAAEVTAEGQDPADGGRITTFDSPAIPSSRLGRIEHPAELWTYIKMMPGKTRPPQADSSMSQALAHEPVPNSRPWTDADDEWVQSFTRAAVLAPGNTPVGNGKTAVTLDLPGSAAVGAGGPGIDMCRTCQAPVAEPSPECTNPFNHHVEGQS